MATSKIIKMLFLLNFLLTCISIVLSCSIAFFYWDEMLSIRKHLDMINEKIHNGNDAELQQNARCYVKDLGDEDMHVDWMKKNACKNNAPVNDLTVLQKEIVVAQFNGGHSELNMGKQSIMGPWVRDEEVSSKNSEDKIELNTNYFTIKEGGLYLIYSQVVYLTRLPNCYFVWARQTGQEPRLLSTCATGDDTSQRPLNKSQMSCSVQTVARLYKGDIVNIAQREHNRTVWLRPGYSYFGFVKLSS